MRKATPTTFVIWPPAILTDAPRYLRRGDKSLQLTAYELIKNITIDKYFNIENI
jgi:hypothetical protein